MTRTPKTPTQRAEEALAVAERKCARLFKERTRLDDDLNRVTSEYGQAVVRRDYLAAHPDLTNPTPTTTKEEGTTE